MPRLFYNSLLMCFLIICLNSCTITISGLVAVDNAIHSDTTAINIASLPKLKTGEKIIVSLTDYTIISGTINKFYYSRLNKRLVNGFEISTTGDSLRGINVENIQSILKVNSSGGFWEALLIGTTIDLAVYLVMTSSSNGFF